jgi:hypothetical protein
VNTSTSLSSRLSTLNSQPPIRLFILSDIHYAGPGERARCDYRRRVITNPLRRLAVRTYQNLIWQRDPFAHNHLLDQFIAAARDADLVIANGDYACDSAFVGMADDATLQSAAECLGELRTHFGDRFHAVIGDHELGKKPLGADIGGLRLDSFHRTQRDLGLKPFWQLQLGNYLLIGVTSTLLALDVAADEAVPGELPAWRDLRARHIAEIRQAMDAVASRQRILLFCHDPTALPFLAELPEVRAKLPQIERTIIGHLHSNLVLFKSRFLCGMPVIDFLGHTPRRLSRALRQARHWKPFHVLLCPSLAGIQLLKDGGYCTIEIDPGARALAHVKKHNLSWKL